jgi:hypothetical protein
MDIIVLECRWFDGMVLPHYCTVHSNLLLLSSNPGINMGKCTYISAHWHSFILYYYWFDRLAFEYVVQFESYKVLEKNTLQIIVHVLFNPINIPAILKYLNVCMFFSSDSCVYGWHLLVVLLSPNLDGSGGVDVADGSEALEQMAPSSPIKWSKDGKNFTGFNITARVRFTYFTFVYAANQCSSTPVLWPLLFFHSASMWKLCFYMHCLWNLLS